MKKSILITLFYTLLISIHSNAADLIVDVNGTGGAYSTIQSAVDASVAGDRIIIYPNVTPFSENITINHSLEVNTAVEGERFRLNGSITVNSNGSLTAGSEVVIVNAELLNGNISTSQNASGGSQVRILGSKLISGYIQFNTLGYNTIVANDSIMNGYVSLRNGHVLGNYIDATSTGSQAIYFNSDSWTASDDPAYIVGNHIICSTGSYISSQRHGIYWGSSQKYAHISNNFITQTSPNYQYGIYIQSSKTGSGENRVENNTITGVSSNTYSMYLTSGNSIFKVHNNLVVGSNINYGIATNSASLNYQVSYNYVEAAITAYANFTDDGTNVESNTNVIDADGMLTAGDAINGGNPDAGYTDLDLTQNDAGCYGGSLSKANYDVQTGITGSKTCLLIAPRRVVAGETIDIVGFGFDH